MQTVWFSLLLVSLISGIVSVLGAGSAFEKYLQYFCALLLTLALLSPIAALNGGDVVLPDLFPEGQEQEFGQVPQAYLKQFEAEIENAVSELLWERLTLPKDACLPIATAKDQEGVPILCRVEVRLYTLKAAAKTAAIRSLLEEACGCDIVIREDVRI